MANAQFEQKKIRGQADASSLEIKPISKDLFKNTHQPTRDLNRTVRYRSLPGGVVKLGNEVSVKVRYRDDNGSFWAEGQIDQNSNARDLDRSEKRKLFVNHALVRTGMDQEGVSLELKTSTRDKEMEHFRFQQVYKDIAVWGNEVTVHQQGDAYAMMGRLQKFPFQKEAVVKYDMKQVSSIVGQDLSSNGVSIMTAEKKSEVDLMLEDDVRELVWFDHEGAFKLAWHITEHPNLASRWEYFIDATNGSILEKHESLCKAHNHPPHFFDGKSVGSGIDLRGDNQTVQTYQVGNSHILLDASRTDMFDPRGPLPSDPIGAILTLDAINTFPGDNRFRYKDLISNSTTWNNPDAVSAHVNAAVAYEYFRKFHGRISINGEGGNIISLINVSDEDGADMDNAFWNGAAIFYGKGKSAFSAPLSKAIDVAAHELTHGVIQTTANLEYQGESGALNESFADIFAVAVEREDYLIGEDIVNKNIFPVALRNLADPHNNGSSLNDPGYQPAHYEERYTGREDNGGVHINSGIPNKAFFLFTEEVGLEVSEVIYYSALTNYLTRSSQFIDLRNAVIAASAAYSSDIRYQEAAESAFDQVGIMAGESGNYTENVDQNPGNDFMLVTSFEDGLLRLIDPAGNSLTEGPLSQVPPSKPPSITDDGSLIVYVAEDKTIHYLEIDWDPSSGGTLSEGTLQSDPIWLNAAISKDGTKLAANLDAVNDSIFVFTLDQEQNDLRVFELYNPTTAEGLRTGNVHFADVLEWDLTSEYLLYDGFNSIQKEGSVESLEYWDIGFMRVWDYAADSYADGEITKLFTGLPEEISIANPTFSKNSPYIIAFDYLDESIGQDALSVLGVNTETYDVGTIYENTVPGYPSFTREDDRLVFDAEATSGSSTINVIAIIDLKEDKINADGQPAVVFENAAWAKWFGNGERSLVNVLEGDREDSELSIFPNPTEQVVNLEADWLQKPNLRMAIYDVSGKKIKEWMHHGAGQSAQIDLADMQPGIYLLKLNSKTVNRVYKLVKQ